MDSFWIAVIKNLEMVWEREKSIAGWAGVKGNFLVVGSCLEEGNWWKSKFVLLEVKREVPNKKSQESADLEVEKGGIHKDLENFNSEEVA